ncbi:DUF3889 domain-containing protein [Paenibacillus antarcticus]|uniref:DUF3889 domain-containing protein n=1 Tax=Paenibacillus antarcticus TaxID=253703 RepID=A0A168MS17_9BACL|nr:DUF3889 domain-containing protein [Paenibacillus antarcticus]OAB44984.1 hypothetical protein PBAT_13615 [Paenibacillus antarcticus]
MFSILKVIISLSLTMTTSMTILPSDIIQAEPSYAKWGSIAVKETQKKYNTSVTDYLHIGSVKLSDTVTEEKFKLIITKNNIEMGVIVTISYNPNNNQLLIIRYEETSP